MLHCCSSSRHQSIYSSIAGYTVVSASSSSSAYIFRRRNQPYTSQDTQFGVIHPKSHRPLMDIILTILIHIFIAIRPLSLLGVITIIVLSFLRGQTASYLSFYDVRYGSSTYFIHKLLMQVKTYSVSQTMPGACEGLRCTIVYTLCLM